jgi:hypothetical protein
LSELLEGEPESPRYTRGVIVALSYEADALEALGKYGEAVEIRERSVEVSRRFLASDEKNAGALLGVAITTRRLGGARFLAGDTRGALASLRESAEVGGRALAASFGAPWAGTEPRGPTPTGSGERHWRSRGRPAYPHESPDVDPEGRRMLPMSSPT